MALLERVTSKRGTTVKNCVILIASNYPFTVDDINTR